MFFLSFIPQTPPASQLLSAVHHHVTDDVTTDRRDLAIITRFCCRPKPSNLSPLFSRRTRLEMRRISIFENTVSCHSCIDQFLISVSYSTFLPDNNNRHRTWSRRSFRDCSAPYKHLNLLFTARCTLVQSAVLRSHVVCLSICLSVCNVGEL